MGLDMFDLITNKSNMSSPLHFSFLKSCSIAARAPGKAHVIAFSHAILSEGLSNFCMGFDR